MPTPRQINGEDRFCVVSTVDVAGHRASIVPSEESRHRRSLSPESITAPGREVFWPERAEGRGRARRLRTGSLGVGWERYG